MNDIPLILVSEVAATDCQECGRRFSFRATGYAIASEPNAAQLAQNCYLDNAENWQVACPQCGSLHPAEARRRVFTAMVIWFCTVPCVLVLMSLGILVDLPMWGPRGDVIGLFSVWALLIIALLIAQWLLVWRTASWNSRVLARSRREPDWKNLDVLITDFDHSLLVAHNRNPENQAKGNRGNPLIATLTLTSGIALPVLAFCVTGLWYFGASHWLQGTVVSAVVYIGLLLTIFLMTRSRSRRNARPVDRPISRQAGKASAVDKKCGQCGMRLPPAIAEAYRRGTIVMGVEWTYCGKCRSVICPDCMIREEAGGVEWHQCPNCRESLDQLSSDPDLGSTAKL